MRGLMCVTLRVFAVGCGKKPDTPNHPDKGTHESAGTGAATSAAKSVAVEPEVTTSAGELLEQYKTNRVGADKRFLSKALSVKLTVSSVGRTKTGEPYIGVNYSDKNGVEPSLMFFFPKQGEESIGGLKRNDRVTVVGICAGRFDDGIPRAFPGYEFNVRLDDCRILDEAPVTPH